MQRFVGGSDTGIKVALPCREVVRAGWVVFRSDVLATNIEGVGAFCYDCMRKAVEFGIPKEQAILSATLIPAREIGREKEIGAIAPGKLADFVVCDGELNQKTIYLDGKKL